MRIRTRADEIRLKLDSVVASYILPSRVSGVQTFGCFFDAKTDGAEETFVIKPWDGVGRRIVVRHVGVEVEIQNGRITEFKLDGRKRFASLTVENPSDKALDCHFEISGLWGTKYSVEGQELEGDNGKLRATVKLAASATKQIDVTVIS